jgi:hypothetical protein
MSTIRLIVILGFICVSSAFAAENGNIVRWSKGTVEYRKVSTGAVTGSEEWRIDVHPDGSRTLNVSNRVDNDNTKRTVVLRVDDRFRPIDLYASFWYRGDWVGTGLFLREGDQLEAVTNTPHGRLTQVVSVPQDFAFVPHPIQANAWQIGVYNTTQGGSQTLTIYDMATRLTGPGNVLGALSTMNIRQVGKVDVKTPAGTFATNHFNVGDIVDIYTFADDHVLAKFVWPKADTEYVLTSYETGR